MTTGARSVCIAAVAAMASVLLCGVATVSAMASSPGAFGLESFEQRSLNSDGSPDTKAGSHPYELVTTFSFRHVEEERYGELEEVPAGGELKDVEIGLPSGLIGNPNTTPKCPRKLFDLGRLELEPHCPADTRVGTEFLTISGLTGVIILPVYNLVPPPGMPAQFGFALQFRVGFLDFGVRTGEGYAVKAVVRNINQLRVLNSSLVLWNEPSEHGTGAPPGPPLLRNPTSCGVPLSDLTSMDSWQAPFDAASPFTYPVTQAYPLTDARGNQLEMSGCGKLDFSPEIEVHPTTAVTSTPTGLDVDLRLPQNEKPQGLAEADLKGVAVTLPEGLTVSPSVANGLVSCSSAQIGLSDGSASACPEASKIGEVEVDTPLLEAPLHGSIYAAAQGDNPFHSLLAIYVTAEGEGVVLKLAGHVQANPATGQLTTTFDENPQLPFSDLKLKFYEGPRAALMTPSACGTYATSAQLSGWNGAIATPAIAPFVVRSGCEAPGFAPAFVAGTTSNVAGAFGTFSTTITRPDGNQQPLGAISITPPPGLLGMLSQVLLCDEAQAEQGSCPAASRIGSVSAIAGPGALPVTVGGGQVFLTGPYKGAPFGLSIVVPAVAGPFNLGNVVVRAAINVDPNTAQVTVVSDPLPSILQGIPLDIRTVNVSIDRPGFMFNPTSCDPLSSTAQIASSQGASVSLSSRFQAADCANLAFHPGFAVSTSAHTSKANGASLTVKVSSGPGQANIAKADLQLPKQLPLTPHNTPESLHRSAVQHEPRGLPRGIDDRDREGDHTDPERPLGRSGDPGQSRWRRVPGRGVHPAGSGRHDHAGR